MLRVRQVAMYFYNVYALRPDILRAAKDDLATMMQATRIATLIDKRFTLDDIAAAHEAVEGGKLIGNAVVEVG